MFFPATMIIILKVVILEKKRETACKKNQNLDAELSWLNVEMEWLKLWSFEPMWVI